MKTSVRILLAMMVLSFNACSQSRNPANSRLMDATIKVGSSCENCEEIYEILLPFEQLNAVDTLPDYNDPGPRLHVSGTIFLQDGRTPANDVVLYIYHTNQQGIYPGHNNNNRHGTIRGWIKTGADGRYSFYTLVPASYPNSNNPKHIHPIVKEPGKSPYWIDDFVFADDPLLKATGGATANPRGGSGLLTPIPGNGVLKATRDIVLGKDVDNYPKASSKEAVSGLDIGEDCPAFDPLHLSGPDKGMRACPMCKYGFGKGVMVWFNHSDPAPMSQFAQQLESEMVKRGTRQLRVFLVGMHGGETKREPTVDAEPAKVLSRWSQQQRLQQVAVVLVPAATDAATAGVFKINPAVGNTVLVYRQRKVAAKWVNIDYSQQDVANILAALQ